MRRNFFYTIGILITVLALVLTGCTSPASSTPSDNSKAPANTTTQPATSAPGSSSNSNSPITGATAGKLEIVVTDAPAKEEITAINVSLKGIEVHVAGSEPAPTATASVQGTQEEKDDSTGWTTIKMDPSKTFDLLKVKDNPEVLSAVSLPIGNYSQIRMEINTITVTFKGPEGTRTETATVPSGKIKFIQPFKLSSTEVTQLIFDFDAGQSVNVAGNGKVMFKPVIKLTVSKKSSAATANKETNTSKETNTGETKANKETNTNAEKNGNSNQALAITTASLPAGKLNTAYAANTKLEATGGKAPYAWSISSGALPAGLTLDKATGVIAGTPTATGEFKVTIKVTDSSNPEPKTLTKEFTLTIAP